MAEDGGDTVVVRYSKAGAVVVAILGVGMLAVLALIVTSGGSASRFVFALIPLAFAALFLLPSLRMWRNDRRALVIDDDAIDVSFLNGSRVHVPWTEVSGLRETKGLNDEPYVVLELRTARSNFRVDGGRVWWKMAGGSKPTLGFPTSRLMLDTKREKLLDAIRAHLPDGDRGGHE
ncbi:MAG TPA: hypothetical protein VKB43_01515 [Gaiellaceae bacterium]|nr:hypothetical protein [Gaiellaceae bacterium]